MINWLDEIPCYYYVINTYLRSNWIH